MCPALLTTAERAEESQGCLYTSHLPPPTSPSVAPRQETLGQHHVQLSKVGRSYRAKYFVLKGRVSHISLLSWSLCYPCIDSCSDEIRTLHWILLNVEDSVHNNVWVFSEVSLWLAFPQCSVFKVCQWSGQREQRQGLNSYVEGRMQGAGEVNATRSWLLHT